MLNLLIAFIVAYLLGSIPFNKITIKAYEFLKSEDTETTGNSSIALLTSTNWKLGIIATIGDFLKAFIAIAVAIILGAHTFSLMLAGLLVIVGHRFPLWFKFKGSKDLTAALGAFCGLVVIAGFVAALVHAAMLYKKIALPMANIVSSIVATIIVLILGYGWIYTLGFVVMTLFLAWASRGQQH